MRLDMFFEKFELFMDATYAVEKVRELVLWFAFSGDLSSEERNQAMPDEWAIEGAPILPAIPSSWTWQQGSTVFQVIRGVSYKKGDASDSPAEGTIPLLRANNIGTGINFDDLVYVPQSNIRQEQFIRRGDILIAMSSGSKKLVGKAAPMLSKFDGAFGAFCGVIRNKSGVLNDFLARYFQSPQYTSWVTAAGKGIGINNLSKSDLDSLPVPTPPFTEQKRIVAKVDELMALCDRLEAQQQERNTRQAALAHASLARFTEAPTPANLEFLFHNSYTITPADLRKTILSLGVQGKLFGPSKDSSTWAAVRMKDVCLLITDGEHATPPRTSSGVPLVTAKNVRDGFLDLVMTDWVAPSTAEKCWKRCKPRHDDILMVCVGATTGRVCLVQNPPDIVLVRSVALIRPNHERIAPTFLNLFLRSQEGQAQIWGGVKQSAQPCLYLGRMSEFEIVLPPLTEQCRIVAKVNQLMALVDELEKQLATAQIESGHLLEAILHEILNPVSSDDNARGEPAHPDVIPLSKSKPTARRPNRHLARALLSAEIVHQLHAEPTFGRTKHQKILHLCEYIARIEEVDGEYHRDAAGPLDNRMMYSVVKELKKQHWYEEHPRETFGNAYRPLEKAGQHRKYLERYWPDKLPVIQCLLDMMRTWDTDRCEIFSTTYAAWNDLLIWKQEPTEEAILKEILERWHERKKRFSEERWRKEIVWMRKEGFVPTGFGKPTR
jgi:type I restriction enzyme S subunit